MNLRIASLSVVLVSCAAPQAQSETSLSALVSHPKRYDGTRVKTCGALVIDEHENDVCSDARGAETMCAFVDLADDPRPEAVDPILALRGRRIAIEGVVYAGTSGRTSFRLEHTTIAPVSSVEQCPSD